MIYEVIVDLASNQLDRTFDYYGEDIKLGSRVLVPFGRQNLIGFVVASKQTSEYADKIKPVQKVLDTPIKSELLQVLQFMKKKYNLRYIDALRLFVPSKMRSDKNAELLRLFVDFKENIDKKSMLESLPKNAHKQIDLFCYIEQHGGEFKNELSKKFGISSINTLIKKEILEQYPIAKRRVPEVCADRICQKHTLNQAQNNASDAIKNGKGVFLLHGVTGSGKTEVYQTVIEDALAKGKTAIMLVPEISLTPQIFGLFKARFGQQIAILHSGLSTGERFDEWTRIFNGDAKVVIGARSAIFSPIENVGVIIIDEEHDCSYQSESNPRYETKSVAIERAKLNNCPLVLGSATPDIETFKLAEQKKYQILSLPDRISKFKPSDIDIVDMTSEFRNGNRGIFSYAMIDALKSTLNRGEQAMIFLNRRGYSSFLMCKDCGYTPTCEACDVTLTYHKSVERLKCHFCGKNYTVPRKCPECGSPNLKFGRTGTEKVVSELHELFENAKIARMDNDTTQNKGAHHKILEDFRNGNSNILVGTQMIAKGHDFPNVTFVGIIDVDFSLFLDDYRASERTFQLVTQVAGRAGRADKQGKVILQTFVPTHYVFKLAKSYNYLGFYNKELNSREVSNFPPYTKFVRILFTSEEDKIAFDQTKDIYEQLKEIRKTNADMFVYLNAMRSPVNKIKNKVRYQILMRIYPPKFDEAIEKIYTLVNSVQKAKLQCFVEINPQSLC